MNKISHEIGLMVRKLEMFRAEYWNIITTFFRRLKYYAKNPADFFLSDKMENLAERTRTLAFENAQLATLLAHLFGNAWVEIDGTRSYGYSRILFVETPAGQISFPIYHDFWEYLDCFPIFDTRKELAEGEERQHKFRESRWDTHSGSDTIHRMAVCFDLIKEGYLMSQLKRTDPVFFSKNKKKNKFARRNPVK